MNQVQVIKFIDTKILKRDEDMVEYYEMCCYYDKVKPTVFGYFKSEFPLLICKVRGHKYKPYDVFTPDRGGIGVECTRCGTAHYHTLY